MSDAPAGRPWLPLRPVTVAVVAVVLLLTAGLSWAAFVVNDHNEGRLLRLKVAETGALLQAALPSLETPLASAAEIAQNGTEGTAGFRQYMAGYVGAKRPFAFSALWMGSRPTPATTLGHSPLVPAKSAAVRAFVHGAAARPGLSVNAFLDGPNRVLAYAYTSTRSHTSVVYAESALPPKPRIAPTSGTPFSDLRFALYLGPHATSQTLLETNADSLGSRTSSTAVPFGHNTLTVVAAPSGSLAGGLSSSLWWIVALAGGVLALLAGSVTEWALRGRKAAEVLAADVQRLLDRQQVISSLLQRAMIPPAPKSHAHLEVATRYLPGGDEFEVGGDWFDVIELDDDRTFFSIGDVSGRGLRAGTVMASLRSAIRALVSEGHGPASLLGLLTPLIDTGEGPRFATVECLIFDRRTNTLTAASAGHPPPLMIRGDAAEYLAIPVGPPIGAARGAAYREQEFPVAADTILLLFTDGLVERRGEVLDEGLARLSRVGVEATGTVDDVLDSIVERLGAGHGDDDTAMLGARLA